MEHGQQFAVKETKKRQSWFTKYIVELYLYVHKAHTVYSYVNCTSYTTHTAFVQISSIANKLYVCADIHVVWVLSLTLGVDRTVDRTVDGRYNSAQCFVTLQVWQWSMGGGVLLIFLMFRWPWKWIFQLSPLVTSLSTLHRPQNPFRLPYQIYWPAMKPFRCFGCTPFLCYCRTLSQQNGGCRKVEFSGTVSVGVRKVWKLEGNQ